MIRRPLFPLPRPLTEPAEACPTTVSISNRIFPGLWSSGPVDRMFSITHEEARDTARRLAELEGNFCGAASDTDVLAWMQLPADHNPGDGLETFSLRAVLANWR